MNGVVKRPPLRVEQGRAEVYAPPVRPEELDNRGGRFMNQLVAVAARAPALVAA